MRVTGRLFVEVVESVIVGSVGSAIASAFSLVGTAEIAVKEYRPCFRSGVACIVMLSGVVRAIRSALTSML